MEKLNKNLWGLYAASPDGVKAIAAFKHIEDQPDPEAQLSVIKTYSPSPASISDATMMKEIRNVQTCAKNILQHIDIRECESFDVARAMFTDIADQTFEGGFDSALSDLSILSLLLYYVEPEYYVPYLFVGAIDKLYAIADAYGFTLPTPPVKAKKTERLMHYMDVCEVLQSFRREIELAPSEFCAFIYNCYPMLFGTKHDTPLPKPTRAWFIGGKTWAEEKDLGEEEWQANADTRRGDILVHYETSPVCSITSVWRALTNGIADPFFWYYSYVLRGERIDVTPLHKSLIKADELLSQHPWARQNFQGLNGREMSAEEYNRLLDLLAQQGQDITHLPRLFTPHVCRDDITNEADVEEKLIVPMLQEMGCTDYERQVTLHLGREEKGRTDFSIHPEERNGLKYASVVVEAKYHIKNGKEEDEAFTQGLSYAQLQDAHALIVCDKERLFIYERAKGVFDRFRCMEIAWEDLKDLDNFNKVKSILE